MSLTQLSAGIAAGVFSLTTIGSELMLGTDKMKEELPAAAKADSTSQKARRDAKPQSPWQHRPMIPSGPKF